MQEIVICGGSGLVGAGLARKLEEAGRSYAVVGRSPEKLREQFPAAAHCLSWAEFQEGGIENPAAVVNLAGASVMAKRWTPEYKQLMTSSRLESTKICAHVCAQNPGTHLISASSVHAYGIYPDDHEEFTEQDRERRSGGPCFLQDMIDVWEEATAPAAKAGCPVTLLRIGVVLAAEGGALPFMLPAFKFFVGGRQGSGKQIMPWISLDDVVSSIFFLLGRPDLAGAVNLTAPEPCTNTEFAKAIGDALDRPSFMAAPAFAVKALMGAAGYELVLSGQRVVPKRLMDAGFEFRDTKIDACLGRMLANA